MDDEELIKAFIRTERAADGRTPYRTNSPAQSLRLKTEMRSTTDATDPLSSGFHTQTLSSKAFTTTR
jgi:hypothetical protein